MVVLSACRGNVIMGLIVLGMDYKNSICVSRLLPMQLSRYLHTSMTLSVRLPKMLELLLVSMYFESSTSQLLLLLLMA